MDHNKLWEILKEMGIPDHLTCLMRNTGLEEVQAGIKIAGRNLNNLRYADNITLMAESEEELKSLFESERGEWVTFKKLRSWHAVPLLHGN